MSKFIIEVRTKGFGKAENEIKRVGTQSRRFAKEANAGAGAAATFRREASRLRNNMLLVSFAIIGTVRSLSGFVKAASDAREQLSQFNIVFGQFAPQAEAFAKDIQSSFGIAKSEMIALLASLQDTLVPLGFTRKHASELSMSIAQLALDVGSFKNVATGDVAQRMTSALIGNHEAVRGLGISLTEATIKTEAMRLGIISVNDEMTQEAKILGRMSLLFKGTRDAQGDLTRTQEEFANQLRGTQGRLKAVQEELGETLLPLAKLALNFTNFIATSSKVKIILSGVVVALGLYVGATIRAAIATATFNGTLRRNVFIAVGTTLILTIEHIARSMGAFAEETKNADFEVKSLDQIIRELNEAEIDLSNGTNAAAEAAAAHAEALAEEKETLEKSETALAVRLALMQEETELMKHAARVTIEEGRLISEVEFNLLSQIDAWIAQNEAKKEAIRIAKELNAAQEEAAQKEFSMQDALAAVRQESLQIQAELDGASDLQIQKMAIVDDALKNIAGSLDISAGKYAQLTSFVFANTQALTMEDLNLQISDSTTKEYVQTVIDLANAKIRLAEDTATLTDAEKEQKQAMQDSADAARDADAMNRKLASGIMTVAGAMKIMTDDTATAAQKMSTMMQTLGALLMMMPGGQVPGALLSAGSMFIGHTGGLVKDNGIQRFAAGGVVRGQDNIPIMAQSGEFIMRREAVQNIGVQNLAQMNQSAQGGGVTVNISAPLVDETVIDHIIPAINRATNRNLA